MVKKLLSVAGFGMLMLSLVGNIEASPLDWFNFDKSENEVGGTSEAELIASAKVSLGQAVTLAEQQTAEKAVSADLEKDRRSGAAYYQIETEGVKAGHKVDVDAQTGKIVKLVNSKHHDDEDHEECRKEKD